MAIIGCLIFAVAGALGTIGGYFLKARIDKGVQHGFDRKLEELKALLRKEELARQADNAARDAKIAALRDGALSGMNARLVGLDQRRLRAAERIWQAVNEMWRERNLEKNDSSGENGPLARCSKRADDSGGEYAQIC
jgi:hypothetical protein